MSYAMSNALQAAIFAQLTADAALTALVGTAIFDALPPGEVPGLYVALGPEKVRDASDADGQGAVHEVTISVVTDQSGFAVAKSAAAAVSDALAANPLTLARGRVLSLRFHKAAAARVGTGGTRRIDLIFRARLSDD
ncbi:DUF3168 domain-containing protein [Loktanella sp. DJP18]|uniref:DUF3168 domain-containing protein n=1 Tax=Loktanella sp. DJP18 TaxID=3409788 RepID=UPI003BB7506F